MAAIRAVLVSLSCGLTPPPLHLAAIVPHASMKSRVIAPVAATEPASLPPPAPPPLLPPLAQLSLLLGAYGVHVTWLSELDIALPFFSRRQFAAENVIGTAVIAGAFARWRRRRPPMRPPPWGEIRTRHLLLIQTACALVAAYGLSIYASTAVEFLLDAIVGLGAPLTVGVHRALQVLMSHLAWVLMATRILGVRLKPFFPPPFGKGQWLRLRWRSSWLAWALGGYFASCSLIISRTISTRR